MSGGGTAGHISPILATLDALKRQDKSLQVLYVGSDLGMEAKIARAAGWDFTSIPSGKFRRYHGRGKWNNMTDFKTGVLNTRDLYRVIAGIVRARQLLISFKPEVVFIKGGYVGLPVGLAAKLLGIPYVIHESDITPGLTNRILGRWAAKIAVGFPTDKYKLWPTEKLTHTGNPIRGHITASRRHQGIKHFNFDDKVPVVLVIGGSQGAHAINEVVIDALPELLAKAQVIHITGETDFESVRFETDRLNLAFPGRYQPRAFMLEDLGLAMAAADAVVSRAGANTIAELAALGKPAILIPHPHLTGNHQTHNAQALARQGAVRLITEDRLNPDVLNREISKILDSESERGILGGAISKLAVTDGSERLAKLIVEAAPTLESEIESVEDHDKP